MSRAVKDYYRYIDYDNETDSDEEDGFIWKYSHRREDDDYDWCGCKMCYDIAEECICCHGIQEMVTKMEDFDVSCITSHPGFETVVLDRFVLETAYCGYHRAVQQSLNEFK
ncbi:hypothetical protein FKM82_013492 [Ascaphus truei]